MACYEIISCDNPAIIEIINTSAVLAPGDIFKPTPSITGPGYVTNCWEVVGTFEPPCGPSAILVTTVISYDSCLECQTPVPPVCYSLTACDGVTVLYTNSDLAAYVGSYITNASYPNSCFYVAVSQTCIEPIVFLNPTPCECPCYTLTDCTGVNAPFNTLSNLQAYVDTVVQLDEYGGCEGPCFQVTLNPGPCSITEPVTVTLGCAPCPPCTCYRLVDCVTRQPYLTLSNPTANGVDLAPLVGQVISKVCLGPDQTECTTGCWEVETTSCTGNQLSVYVYDTFLTCEACTASCYKLTNCETLTEVLVQYAGPNATLPNISTLVGQTVKDICFTEPTGCLTGCWTVSISDDPDCLNSVDWRDAISYTAFSNCEDCLPKCYLLTECAPATTEPFVVSNDLSIYLGSTIKVCDSNDVCKCYNVTLAQSCSGAVLLDNVNAQFITCEECNACYCPPGYEKIDDRCQKITSLPATLNPQVYTATQGNISNQYGSLGTRFYAGVSSLPYPLTAVTGPDRFVDASSANVVYTSDNTNIWGGPVGSRLNAVGVWTTAAPAPLNEWIGFTKCIVNTEATTYCVGIGGEDHVRIKLDGVIVAEATIGAFDYNYWHVFELSIPAGTHVIVVEGRNTGLSASFGAEIYSTDIATLSTITTALALQAVTIFTTFSMRANDSSFDTGEESGYSCPPGYTYNNCGAPSCSLIETIPYTDCAPTYRVTDCAGIQPPVITNTDLSSFLTGSYSACLEEEASWPIGCYCVTVEQIEYEIGVPFPALFADPGYDCCEDCSRVCYVLTDCNNVLNPVTVCNDLADYVGKIIKIASCGDICWQVAVAQNCNNDVLFAGEITEFDTCEDCLPPAPPLPLPYDLHLRKIKPGYNSPNSCYTTSYIEKVNCSFAEQVYNAMLVKRYGITMCCEEDLTMWDIKKQLMDLDILKDPNMCKSTLCDCKPPCLIDAVIALLPFCGEPLLISADLSLLCPEPVVTTTLIEVSSVLADCNCYTITPLEQPIEMLYLDCCCVLQRVLIDSLEPVSLCASSLPVIYPQPSSANVVLNGNCDELGPCNPPVCYCWKVTNTNPINTPDGGASFNGCDTGPFALSTFAFVPAGQSVSHCSFNPPTVSEGLVVENMGPCVDGSCVPPVCQCYSLTLNDGGLEGQCEFAYTDCNGVPQTVLVLKGQTVYLCAQTTFTPMCARSIDYTLLVVNNACQPDGTCNPPLPCVCYIVTVETGDGLGGCELDYTPCGGAPTTQFFPVGANYICSEVVPTVHPGGQCTIIVQSTPLDCGLGECQP